MVFCGRSFCADRNSLNHTPVSINDIQTLQIQNGVFDTLHVTRDGNYQGNIPNSVDSWNYDTIMLALFDNNLLAGNISYALSQVSSIRVKGRVKGTFEWITYYEIPINKIEDFYFDIYHKYCKADETYEFALVPVIGNIEGNININEIHSMFDGLFLIEKDKSYSTLIISSFSAQKNRPTSYVQTINRKYPYVFSAGDNDFFTGSVSGEFIANNSGLVNVDNPSDLIKSSPKFREELMNFLTNGNTKILKMYNGKMWMVNIINSPSEQSQSIPYMSDVSFEWVEVGDTLSSNDLSENNLIDVNVEGS